MSQIEVRNLKKDFTFFEKEAGLKGSFRSLFHRVPQTREAVKGVSFTIEEGEIIGFIGPNGAGKTTTLKMLSGILYPTSGAASVLGYVPWERKSEFKTQFSIVMGQKSQLWWDLPANESFYLTKCIYEVEDAAYQKTIDELTEWFDVKHLLKVQVRNLSLGERMKMELIASLINKPKILFLDEPTIGLDPVTQIKMREFLKQYNETYHATIMLTSHYLEDIEALSERIIMINRGTMVYDGDINGIRKMVEETKKIHLDLKAGSNADGLKQYGTLIQREGMHVILEVKKADVVPATKKIMEQYDVLDIAIENIPFEESVIHLYE